MDFKLSISGENIDLGSFLTPPIYSYTVINNDTDNTSLTCNITLNDIVIETPTIVSGIENTFAISEEIFNNLNLETQNTLIITVSNGNETVVRTITFKRTDETNNIPTTPINISFSNKNTSKLTIDSGDTINISWTESTDTDKDILYYDVYFYDGSRWNMVKANYVDLNCDFIIPPTLSNIKDCKFRVRAYDLKDYSDWCTSLEFEINKIINYEFILNGEDTDLGNKLNSFITTYSFNDTNANNTITLMVKLDDLYVETISNAERNKEYVYNLSSRWEKLENKQHSIEIIASNGKEVLIRTYIFTKIAKENYFPIISGSDENLGVIKESFSKTYTISDKDTLTKLKIEKKLDNVVFETIEKATNGGNYTLETSSIWETLSVGIHRLSLVLSDDYGNSVVRNCTFYKDGIIEEDTHKINRKYLYNEEQYRNVKLKLLNPDKTLVAILNTGIDNYVYDMVKTDTMNESSKLTFKMGYRNNHINIDSCEMLIQIIGSNQYFIIKSVNVDDNDNSILDISCVSEEEELKGILIEIIDLDVTTPEGIFNHIKEAVKSCELDYYWKGTDVDPTKQRSIEIDDECSVFEAFVSMAEKFNGWLEFSTDTEGKKWVYLRTKDIDNGKYIIKGKDLTQINITYDSSGIITRMYGFGDTDSVTGNEIDITMVNPTGKPYIEDYSYFLSKGMSIDDIKKTPRCLQESIMRNTDYVDDIDLYRATQEELKKYSVPKLDGSINLLDFSIRDGSSLTEPLIGELVTVIDKDINFSMGARIQSIERKFTENPYDVNVTISNLIAYNSVFKDLVVSAETIDRVVSNGDDGDPYIPIDKVKDSDGFNLHFRLGDMESNLDMTAKKLQTNFDNYANATHSQFLQTSEEISTRVEKEEFGTYMRQNAESWLYCFNHVSNYIEFDSTGIWCKDQAFGSGYTCMSTQGLVHMDNKDDPLGKPYHYLSWSDWFQMKCSGSDYTTRYIALPERFLHVKPEDISVNASIKKLYDSPYGRRVSAYWSGVFASIENGQIRIDAMSTWRDWDDDGKIYYDGIIDVTITLIA